MNAAIEGARLRRLTWAALQRRALDAGVPLAVVTGAATRDELRLAILAKLADRAGSVPETENAT